MICKTFSRIPIPAKLMGKAEIVSFNRHDGKKINQRHADAQRIRGKQESRKGRKMCDDRRTKRNERCPPMMRIEMIGREDLNQFIASRKMGGKMEQFESTDDERRNQEGNRRAQKNEQQPE